MPEEPAVVPVATVEYLVDDLAEEDLDGLRRNETILPKKAILPAAPSKANDV